MACKRYVAAPDLNVTGASVRLSAISHGMSYESLAAQAVQLIKSALDESDGHRRMLLLEEGVRLHRAAVEISRVVPAVEPPPE